MRSMKENTHWQAIVPAPGFALGVHCNEQYIQEIVFLPPQAEMGPESALAAEAVTQLTAWLHDAGFHFDLPLERRGTLFQQRVWAAIAAIKQGQTRTYGEIARELGNVPRAVGQACGANPFPVIVPCHRVLAATGLGGFAHERTGLLLDIKRWLLSHEAIASTS